MHALPQSSIQISKQHSLWSKRLEIPSKSEELLCWALWILIFFSFHYLQEMKHWFSIHTDYCIVPDDGTGLTHYSASNLKAWYRYVQHDLEEKKGLLPYRKGIRTNPMRFCFIAANTFPKFFFLYCRSKRKIAPLAWDTVYLKKKQFLCCTHVVL